MTARRSKDKKRSGLPITATTRAAAVIGAPVTHSLSPALHNAAFAATGIDAVYLALHVEPNDLDAAVAGFRATGMLGISVTVPHKERIVPLCDQLDPPADRIGAVNCLTIEKHRGKPTIVGHNTDAGGFVDSLVHDANMDPVGCRAVILGAGGAARAVYAGLHDAGATHIDVIARNPKKAAWTAAKPWTEDSLADMCRRSDLLVDCTSAGLSPDREAKIPASIPIDDMPDSAVVASLVYHRKPALLKAAEDRGLRTLDGAGMLVYQGARAFELWTDVEAPIAAMWRAMREAVAAGDK